MSAEEAFVQSFQRESQFQAWLNARLRENHWLEFHAYRSQHSSHGFPDTCAAYAGGTHLLFAELKIKGRKPTPAQVAWLRVLKKIARVVNRAVGYELMIVRLWSPYDRKEIMRTIARRG